MHRIGAFAQVTGFSFQVAAIVTPGWRRIEDFGRTVSVCLTRACSLYIWLAWRFCFKDFEQALTVFRSLSLEKNASDALFVTLDAYGIFLTFDC
jgi:hypothetical protein